MVRPSFCDNNSLKLVTLLVDGEQFDVEDMGGATGDAGLKHTASTNMINCQCMYWISFAEYYAQSG